jgi:hypothetical protein
MAFMIVALLFVLAAVRAAVRLAIDARRRRAPEPPLVHIQAFALDPVLLATINLVSLWAGRKQFRAVHAV